MGWIIVLTFAVALAACGTSEPVAECSSNQDCTGDPGAGCEWLCIDHLCEKSCPQQCQEDADCQDLPWTSQCTGHWECIGNECQPVCDPVTCTGVADCLELTPPEDCEGHWECTKGECIWVCDKYPCTTLEDCGDIPWPLQCPGHWECTAGYCDPVCDSAECQTAGDCENLTLPCDHGHWICENGDCLPVCEEVCQSVADCLDLPWNVKCLGHWSCEEGLCVEVCDDVACGDGDCDPEGGESAASCAVDCLESCQVAQDCEKLPWPLQCPGHWECQLGECVPVCDTQPECLVPSDCADHLWAIWCYGHWACEHGQCIEVCDSEGCGDDQCDLDGGETPDSCPLDCSAACQAPVDCVGLVWDVRCVGHWDCQQGECVEVCDDVGCGNGICDVQGGESAESCPLDCTQDCRAAIDCLDHEWNVFCQGHWECIAGICSTVCDMETCGDGVCDPWGGETATSCAADCDPACQVPADCLGLSWLVDCLGHWGCENGRCVEVCDFVGCGDGQCDREGGESPQSCPDDCATACGEEGFPTGIPPACCSGLHALAECVPDQPCPGSLLFCVDCGDRSCDPHENPYNCLDDCPQGCPAGEERGYQCPNGPEVDWCVCRPPECRPVCLYLGTRSEGWYDSCTGALIEWTFCSEDDVAHQSVCMHIATDSEGWYDETTGELILWDYCAPLWDCIIDPKAQCL